VSPLKIVPDIELVQTVVAISVACALVTHMPIMMRDITSKEVFTF
jgi:hypothetical protein